VAVAVAVAAIDGPRPAENGPGLALKGGRAVQIKSSHRGHAVLKGEDMAPGDTRKGKVKVSVERRAKVSLRVDKVKKQPGPRGGVLAKAMQLRIKRIGRGPGKRTVYKGRVKRVGKRKLGTWDGGESHRYRVKVTLPASADSQDSLQGARTGFRMLWRASG
jgi:hypothetical protein